LSIDGLYAAGRSTLVFLSAMALQISQKASCWRPSVDTTGRIISRYVNDIRFQRLFGKTELAMSAPSTSPSGRLRRATRSPGNSPAEREQINEANKKYWRDARTLSLENGEFDTIGYGAVVNV
jgi:hypothetical protein